MSSNEDKNVTRSDIAEAIYSEVGLSLSESSKILDQVLDEMSKVLEQGEAVKISSFGSFLVRSKKMRMGRNPKTGVDVPISPRRILSFHPSHILKKIINKKQ